MASDISIPFTSPPGSSGSFWVGSYLMDAGTPSTFSPAVNWGTANASYAAHVWFVLGGTGGVVLRVTGTSITDLGVRTAADTEDIDTTGYVTNDIIETDKKWLGQVTISVVSGTPTSCNYGWCKYWDNFNRDFVLRDVEAIWLGGANDSAPDIHIHHYQANGTYGWTYNAGAAATLPSPFASMSGDHVTEIQVRNGQWGAWKRTGVVQPVRGTSSEGLLFEVVTSANGTFEQGVIDIRVQDSPGDDIAVTRIAPRLPVVPENPEDMRDFLEELRRTLIWDLDAIHRSIWSLNVYGGGNTDEGPDPAAEP